MAHFRNAFRKSVTRWVSVRPKLGITAQKLLGLILFSFSAGVLAGQQPTGNPQGTNPAIKVDQVGYLSDAPKIAFYAGTQLAESFTVRNTSSGKEVFRGKLGIAEQDRDTGDRVQQADFTGLKVPGTYVIEIPGVGRSWRFDIGSDVYARAYSIVMRGFYGQRCGTAVDMAPEFAGYKHAACHLHGEFHPSSGKMGVRDNLGGWHDAGDYGRYTVNSGISTGSLLWAWEMFGARLKDRRLNIPESGKGTPDILSEARWNIEWMLKMQDEDGGAWHKQTSTKFADFIAPEADKLTSEVIGTGAAPFKSTCATADLGAVAAIAARVYAPFDKKFADKNLAAARKAWEWAAANPKVTFRNPAGVVTGEYGDNECGDEMLWLSAELWRTTGEQKYNQYFVEHYRDYLKTVQDATADSWAQLAPMALWTYALAVRRGGDASAVEEIRKTSAEAAREIVRRTRANPYQVSLTSKDYVWGSNGLAAQYSVQLLVTNALAPDESFPVVAMENLHYLFGRNTFSLSWVTQLGENPFHHPHHRPSVASGLKEPWPGLLSGGPNAGRQDDALKALPTLPPAKVYVDDTASYASNEIAINWQAALAFALAGELRQSPAR